LRFEQPCVLASGEGDDGEAFFVPPRYVKRLLPDAASAAEYGQSYRHYLTIIA
jgi:hypothetical protein